MKTRNFYLSILLFASILFASSAYAQSTATSPQAGQSSNKVITPNQTLAVPSTMNYQAVARNGAGAILANQTVGLRLTIEDGAGGAVLYQERQTPTTNQFGLLTVKLGNGTVLSGTWAGINWSNGNQWLKVDMDPTGGTSYIAMGESELLSVPFANYSVKSGDNQWTLTGSDISNNNTGAVNIGTTTTTWPLHVHSDPFPEIHFTSSTTGQSSGDGFMVGFNQTNGEAVVWNWENEDLFFGTNATQRMMIKNTGDVGIGIAAPASRLDVNGNASATTPVLNVTNNYSGTSDVRGIKSYSIASPGWGYGVEATGGFVGVYGEASATTYTGTGYGVYGYANGSAGTRIGVYGYASGGTVANWAGYFDGNLYASDKVGLGLVSIDPETKVHIVEASTIESVMLLGESGGSLGYLTVNRPSTAVSGFPVIARFRDDGSTQATFGLAADAYQLTVYGSALASGGTWTNSDKRIKTDIKPLNNAMTGLMKLNPTSYYYNKAGYKYLNLPSELQFGLVAQEVKEVFPNVVRETVMRDEDGKPLPETLHALNYSELIPVLIKGMQEQQKLIDDLKTEVQQLKSNK
jgi:hypothetical protein